MNPVAKRISCLLLCLGLVFVLSQREPTPAGAQGQTKLVLAFYYAWYNPGSFGPGKTPFQPPQPYSSSDAGTIQRQVNEARSAGIDGFVQSWYGPSEPYTNGNFQTLLNIASASGFKAAIDFEPAALYSSHDERAAALRSLLDTHANHPAYLRVDGKPVIFFWANWLYSVDEWAYIRSIADPNHTSIWIAEGGNYQYLAVFDGMHLYNIAWSANPAGINAGGAANTRAAAATYGSYKYWVGTAMPGFDDRLLGRGDASVYRDRAGGAYFQNSFAGAAASSPDMLIITSFNEWPEGSNIEPSVEFGNFYLDLSAQMSATYKAGGIPAPPPLPAPTEGPPPTDGPSPTPVPTNTPGPTATPLPTEPPTATPTPIASPTPDFNGRIYYTAIPGDSFMAISDRFQVPLADIYQLNNLTADSVLLVGQTLLLGYGPTPAPTSPPAGAFSFGVTTSPTPANVRPDGAVIYIVKEGETLLGLSDRLQVALEDLLQMNALTTDSVLLAGQVLIIGYQPAPDASGGSVDLPQPTASPTPIFAPTLSPTLAPPTLPPPTVASATELANVPAVFASATPAPPAGQTTTTDDPLALPMLAGGSLLLLAAAGIGVYLLRQR